MSHVTYPQNGVLSSEDLARLTGFDRRHIPRKAANREIPDARRTKGGHWEFPVTENLRAWICFYRVRHALLRKNRSSAEDETLKYWGTDWSYALETFDYLNAWLPGSIDCGDEGVFKIGPNTTWETVEAVALKSWFIPQRGWRAGYARLGARLGRPKLS